jgi:D-3-phosphoglycerate dehydrogenase
MREGFKILIIGNTIAEEAIALLEKNQCQYAFSHMKGDSASISTDIRKFQPEGLIIRKGKITREALQASERLRAICKHGVGVDNIDVIAATEMRIPVLITALANFESVAEHTLGLMFSLLRMIPRQHDYVKKGGWDKADYHGEDLSQKTLGVIGFGRIGKRLCELVIPLQMKILVYDPYVSSSNLPPFVHKVSHLNEMLPSVDILSIHCPLTEETESMIGKDALEKIKRGAWIINTSRGKIIEENALVESLRLKQIRGVALDTLAQEPPDPLNPLLSMENVIITNHIGSSSNEAIKKMGISAVCLVIDVLRGKIPDPSYVVNPEILG